jgi:hypothetical protein
MRLRRNKGEERTVDTKKSKILLCFFSAGALVSLFRGEEGALDCVSFPNIF